MAKKIVAQPNATNNKATTPTSTYCPRCNESGMFCFCDVEFVGKAKTLEVKRIKRGTFLFSFGGGAAK